MKDLEIWIFGDHRNFQKDRSTLQVIGYAHSFLNGRGRVTLLLLGNNLKEMAQEYIAFGADRILLIDHPELTHYRVDLFTSLICDLIKEYQPDLFLAAATDFGRELSARMAKRLGVGLCADCISLEWDEKNETLLATSPAFGGNFLAKIRWDPPKPYMVTLRPGVFHEPPYHKERKGEIIKIKKDLDKLPSRIRVISSFRESPKSTRLEEAKIVIVGGRGVRNSEGFNLLRELSMLLGGEVGATRPSVDAHWASPEQLIGQTGKTVKPKLLLSFGTSGAIQYTSAIRGAETIIAINRDPYAPIFKIADFGVIADSQSFLPAFLVDVKTHLFQEITELYRTKVKGEGEGKAITFGQRIKKLREDHKMSTVELAEKIGQSPEFIEEVESDRLTPPVSFLLQLSRALEIDPSHFFTEQEKVEIEGKRQEAFIKRTQNYSYRTLTPGAADKHLRAFMVTIEPREHHKIVEYKHPGEEFIFVYKGELELTLGNKVFHLKEGETIHFDSEIKHKLRNLSDEKCELIVTLYTP